MVETRSWAEDDPGGGTLHLDPGDAGGYQQTFGTPDVSWVTVKDPAEKEEDRKSWYKLKPRQQYQVIVSVIPEARDIKKIAPGVFLFSVPKEKEHDVTHRTSLSGHEVLISRHKKLNQVRGTVTNEDFAYAEYTADLIKEDIEDPEDSRKSDRSVINVRKIQTFDKEKKIRVDSKTIEITWDRKVLPRYVKIGYIRARVKQFLPNPLLCMRCGDYNHIAKYCKSPEMCGWCGKPEHREKDSEGNRPRCTNSAKCLNCQISGHPVWDRNCKRYKAEKEIAEIMEVRKISYNAAKKSVHEEKQASTTYANKTETLHTQSQVKVDNDGLSKQVTELTQMIKMLCGAVFSLVTGQRPDVTELVKVVNADNEHINIDGDNRCINTVKRTRLEEEGGLEETMDFGQGSRSCYSEAGQRSMGNWGPFASAGYYTSSSAGPAVRLKDPG